MTDGKMKDDPRAEVIGLLNLIANIREAVGDPTGKLMQSDLVERCRELRAKAEPPGCFEPLPIGKQLKALREARGMSLRKLGDECGVCFAQLWKYEKGRVKPAVGTLEKIGEVLDFKLYLK
jgi:DNA-binding Xre family transcriptional regulator